MKNDKVILWIGIGLSIFVLTSLVLMSQSLQNSQQFSNYYSALLLANSGCLLTLLVLIVLHLKKLVRQYKNKVVGARITIRIVVIFALLSVAPILVLYYFSLDFLNRGIDNWFDLRVEQALDDSLDLSRLALDMRMRELLSITEQAAESLSQHTAKMLPFEIDTMRSRMGAEELTLLTRKGSIVATSAASAASLIPARPDEVIMLQLQQGTNYIGLDTLRDAGLLIRAVVSIPKVAIASESYIIQALFPISERINKLANSVQFSYIKYKELSYLREQLKLSLVIILTLVLLFSILAALWAAVYSAKKLSAPVKDLAEGTRAIAAGNYSMQLPVSSSDELGFLVASFNDMTKKIAQARDTAKKSQQETMAQQDYLETILSCLSSGVIVLDAQDRVKKFNVSALQILNVEEKGGLPQTLYRFLEDEPQLTKFIETIEHHINDKNENWRTQITINLLNGNKILMISGAVIPVLAHGQSGHVIVFDDITTLIKGQRDAVWREMAKRLAHEIKNPLTPIQLSAERLRYKYMQAINKDSADALNRLTDTIIHQVELIKNMVNNFSNYARVPAVLLKPIAINPLIEETINLYSYIDKEQKITVQLEEVPLVHGDSNKLRQVFNNLFRNAIDANLQAGSKILAISSRYYKGHEQEEIEIKIQDTGPGIDEGQMHTFFEPYFTSKKKGSGLGLAIVKKIIGEHGGQIWLKNNQDNPGACAVIRLPIYTEKTSYTKIIN